MVKIKLTQNKVTFVDQEWFEYVNQWKWYAHYNPYTKSYYAVRNSSRKLGKRKRIYLHRVVTKAPQNLQVDHINHDTLDNTLRNLRICTASQNCMNKTKSVDGYKGIVYHKNKWQAQISVNRKYMYLGRFSSAMDAAKAYDKAAKKYHGEFAKTNF